VNSLACRAAKSVHVTVVDGYGEEKRTMDNAVLMEIEKLRRASMASLRERFREVFQEEPRSRHRGHLFRRIAWRLQALAEGDLTERARERANEIGISSLATIRFAGTRSTGAGAPRQVCPDPGGKPFYERRYKSELGAASSKRAVFSRSGHSDRGVTSAQHNVKRRITAID
jgi:hypothetical protein